MLENLHSINGSDATGRKTCRNESWYTRLCSKLPRSTGGGCKLPTPIRAGETTLTCHRSSVQRYRPVLFCNSPRTRSFTCTIIPKVTIRHLCRCNATSNKPCDLIRITSTSTSQHCTGFRGHLLCTKPMKRKNRIRRLSTFQQRREGGLVGA
jgi:hypothetical protein